MSNSKTKAIRRKLSFHTMDDLLKDAQALVASGAQASGKWSPAQVIVHVSAVIEASVDGVSFTLPLPLRIVGRLIRNRSLKKGFPAGIIKIPPKARPTFDPPPSVTLDEAIDRLTSAVQKAEQSRMQQPSPIFGRLSHEQWVQVHCRHAELHFSFLSPVSQPHDANDVQSNGKNERHAAASA